MNNQGYVKCPKCLKDNDLDVLEGNTEYSCWSGSEVPVTCLHCDFSFNVDCEHAGYQPTREFDMRAFKRIHNIKVPDDIYSFADYYFHRLIDGRTIKPVTSAGYPEHDSAWLAAHDFALVEWKRITGYDHEDHEDEPLQEG
jgi:hypothetical protein